MQWYYAENDASGKPVKQIGPFTEQNFQALVTSGKVTDQTLVWHEGMPSWTPYGGVKAAGEAPVQPQAVEQGRGICVECSRIFPLDEMITYEGATVCAECKPKFFQRVQEGVETPGVMEFAGFWIRFAAFFIDNVIKGIISYIINIAIFVTMGISMTAAPEANLAKNFGGFLIAYGLVILAQFIFYFAYNVFFVGKYGATPGKMACKLRILRADGSRLTYGRAIGRFFASWLSYMTMYVGFIMAGFDEEKRALHDRVCDTRVVKTE